MLVIGLRGALLEVTLDGWDERDPCEEVSDTDGQESKSNLRRREPILIIHQCKTLDEHENQRVGESTQQRQHQHNRFCQEHAERPDPGDQNLPGGEALLVRCDLVGTPDIHGLSEFVALGTSLLGDAVHHDGGARLGDENEVSDLCGAAEDELDPDGPAPGEVLLDEAADNGAEDRATDRGEDNKGLGMMSAFRLYVLGIVMHTTAYCWLSGSHISATIPSVTEPPAVDKPPSARNARIVPKLGAMATGI